MHKFLQIFVTVIFKYITIALHYIIIRVNTYNQFYFTK